MCEIPAVQSADVLVPRGEMHNRCIHRKRCRSSHRGCVELHDALRLIHSNNRVHRRGDDALGMVDSQVMLLRFACAR
jgi:hypothetical protein